MYPHLINPDKQATKEESNLQAGYQQGHLEHLRTTFEHFPAAVVVTDEAGHPIGYNQAAVAILGKIPTDLNPEDWPEQFGLYLDDGKTYYPGRNMPLLRALQGENVEAEEIILHHSGAPEDRWVSISARPLNSEEGRIIGAFVVFEDITADKRVEISREKKNRWAEALYTLTRQIPEVSNDPVKILNTVAVHAAELIGDGCVATLLNPAGDRLKVAAFHHVRPTARALLRESVISREYPLEKTIAGVVNSGEPLLVPILDQNWLKAVISPEHTRYLDEIGLHSLMVVPIKGRNGVFGTLALLRDLGGSSYTAEDQTFLLDVAYRAGLAIENTSLVHSLRMESSGRRIAEIALEQSEVRFQSIFASTSLGIKILDLDGNILETNLAFQHMLGYSEDELNGLSITSISHPADARRLLQVLDNLKNGQIQSFRLEHRLLRKDGSQVWVNAAFTGIKKIEQEASLSFIVAIAENITERKQMEAEMAEMKSRLHSHVEMERLQLAQELHDGSLQDLYSAVYKIEDWSGQAGHEIQEKLESLKLDLLKVIQELRTTAKELRPPAIAKFGLEKAIRSHAEEFNVSHNDLKIHLTLAPDGQFLPEDLRLILFRIYQHSLANVLRHAQASQVHVQFTFDAEEAQLEVRDNGVGFVVPDNWVELVRQGHFGLAGAVERVALLEGEFTVESKPGSGTTVRVVIPIKDNIELTGDAGRAD